MATNRDCFAVTSLALVNRRRRDAAYDVLYCGVKVSCSEDAEELTTGGHRCRANQPSGTSQIHLCSICPIERDIVLIHL